MTCKVDNVNFVQIYSSELLKVLKKITEKKKKILKSEKTK